MQTGKVRAQLLCSLVAVWGLGLLLLGLLHLCHAGVGLDVWPCGEDENMLNLLQTRCDFGMPYLFWKLDGRNPLTPWLYEAARPLLTEPSGHGCFLISRLMDLCLALSVFLLLDEITRRHSRYFAFVAALLTLLWIFSFRQDNIIWPYQGGLCLSLLSLALVLAPPERPSFHGWRKAVGRALWTRPSILLPWPSS
jgi:hypothetical protein